MKKPTTQPSFASLTEAELEQLAEAVQRETYDAVRERICKPRSEGGLDLNFTSNSPLFRLHEKKNKLDLLNARLRAQCPEQRNVTLSDLNAFISFEKRAPEEVHEAILGLTYDLVTERDNTPHQLLALQRLADFPARAAIREQGATIRANREQRAQAKAARDAAKENRAIEMHTHKIAFALRKEAHQLDMDQFRKNIATQRLELHKRAIAPRESIRSTGGTSRAQSASLSTVLASSPTSEYDIANPAEETNSNNAFGAFVGDDVRSPFPDTQHSVHSTQDPDRPTATPCNTPKPSKDESDPDFKPQTRNQKSEFEILSATENSSEKTQDSAPSTQHLRVISPRPLPPEVIEANLRYAEKVRTGKIIIDRSGPWLRAVELAPDDPQSPPNAPNPQTQPPPEANPRPLSASG